MLAWLQRTGAGITNVEADIIRSVSIVYHNKLSEYRDKEGVVEPPYMTEESEKEWINRADEAFAAGIMTPVDKE